jgi:hypothetical protein
MTVKTTLGEITATRETLCTLVNCLYDAYGLQKQKGYVATAEKTVTAVLEIDGALKASSCFE